MPPVLTNQTTPQGIQSMMNTALSSMGQPTINQPSGFGQDTDLRSVGAMDPRLSNRQQGMPSGGMDLDMRMMPNQMMGMNYDQRQSAPPQRQFQSDPRQRGGNDPRDPRQKVQQQQQQQHPQQSSSNSLAAQLHRGISNDASDQEKAALIMQVLKLTDEQIAILPPEQRASILVLKEQIAKSAMK
jgi:cleavage stimulation factor subunit 2